MSQLRARDGHFIPFNPFLLEQSLAEAFLQAGSSRDEIHVRNLAERVAESLMPRLESGLSTVDVRDHVVHVLRAEGESAVADAYERVHQPGVTHNERPVSLELPLPPSATQEPVASAVVSTMGETVRPRRRRLSEERRAITHKFRVGDQEGYITVGLYDDGQPGEIFLRMSKEGSLLSGLMDCFATSISIGLQYGVPLKVLVRKFRQIAFAPNGETENPNIPTATSIIDYVFRWLSLKFLSPEDRQAIEDEIASASSTEELVPRLGL